MKALINDPRMRDRIVAGSKIHHVFGPADGARVAEVIEFFIPPAKKAKPGTVPQYFGRTVIVKTLPIRIELDAFQFHAPPHRGAPCLLKGDFAVWLAGRYLDPREIHDFAKNEGFRFVGMMKHGGGDLVKFLNEFRKRGLDKGKPFSGTLAVWTRPITF